MQDYLRIMEPSDQLRLPYLPRRIEVAREQSGLHQADLAKKLGLNDRQTIAQMESGQRRVSPDELVALMEATGKDFEFFTDPFLLVGEGAFSYRASGIKESTVDSFEERAGRWIALWRHLGIRREEVPTALRRGLALNNRSLYEDAQLAGEAVAQELKLGKVPAQKLVEAIESTLNILVLHVDMPSGVSGVAVKVPTGDAILINRHESSGRRAFDLAHELFHVLTWDAMPPARVDRQNPTGYKEKRIEQLADNFAAALLMPASEIKLRWEKRASLPVAGWVKAAASHFDVSADAVCYRLVALGLAEKAELPIGATTATRSPGSEPPAFSRRFIERLSWGIENGEISVRKMLEVLGITLKDFRNSAEAHGIRVEIGL